jgi:isoamylase
MKAGSPYPIGASVTATGVNFSVFSYYATHAELLLYDTEEATQPSRIIDLIPGTNRTSHYWHVHLPGIKAGQLYGYRISGPYAPDLGQRFDPEKILLDPYAKAISSRDYQRGAAARSGNNMGAAAKSVVADLGGYDWEGDRPLDHPFSSTVLYEVHVAGFIFRGCRGEERHVCGADREDSVPEGSGDHRSRADACLPVRRPGCASRSGELLGL